MYVCVCKGITEEEIFQAVIEGADSMKAIRQTLGVATDCGQCGCSAKQTFKKATQLQQRDMHVEFYTP